MNYEWTEDEKQAIINEVIRLRDDSQATVEPYLCDVFDDECSRCPYRTILGMRYCMQGAYADGTDNEILLNRAENLVLACGLELPEEQKQQEKRTMTSEELAKMIASRFVMSPQALQKCDEIALALVGVTIVK